MADHPYQFDPNLIDDRLLGSSSKQAEGSPGLGGVGQGTEKNYLELKRAGGKPVYITREGEVIAKKFIDDNDDWELFTKGDSLYWKSTPDIDNHEEHVNLLTGERTFIARVAFFLHLRNTLAVWGVPYSTFNIFNTLRFAYLKKNTKTAIVSSAMMGQQTVFHTEVSGKNWANPYVVHSTSIKPFKVPVEICAAKDIRGIHDIIIIKTGEYATGYLGAGQSTRIFGSGLKREGIVYVSPHEIFNRTGYLLTTGFFHNSGSGTAHTYSGASGISYMPQKSEFNYVTSRNLIIPSGSVLASTGVVYQYITMTGTGIGAIASQFDVTGGHSYTGTFNFIRPTGLRQTNFYNAYTGVLSGQRKGTSNKRKLSNLIKDDNVWDGVIPSGVPFKLEIWNTKNDIFGFDGSFHIKPVSGHLDDFQIKISGSGVGRAYTERVVDVSLPSKFATEPDIRQIVESDGIGFADAQRAANDKAWRQIYRKLDRLLVAQGIRESGRSLIHYQRYMGGEAYSIFGGGLAFLSGNNETGVSFAASGFRFSGSAHNQ